MSQQNQTSGIQGGGLRSAFEAAPDMDWRSDEALSESEFPHEGAP